MCLLHKKGNKVGSGIILGAELMRILVGGISEMKVSSLCLYFIEVLFFVFDFGFEVEQLLEFLVVEKVELVA
jgi:hypothetical protein